MAKRKDFDIEIREELSRTVTVVYEADADRTEYIYFEQDGMTATLYNWLNGRLSISQIEALKCEIIVPEDGE